mgnify:CR=1 FL=1
MQESVMQRRYEQILSRILRDPDPVQALQKEAEQIDPKEPLAAALGQIDSDGLRMTALLVARLRFERLIQGSPQANRWFEEDAASFAETFRTYHAQTPMRAFFPREEAEDFARFCRKRSYARKERKERNY